MIVTALVCVGALLTTSGCAPGPRSSPRAALECAISAAQQADAEAAAECTDATPQEIEAGDWGAGMEGVQAKIIRIEEDGRTAVGEVQFTMSDGETSTAEYKLSQSEDGWRVLLAG